MKPARLLGTTLYTNPQRSQRRPWVSIFDRANRDIAILSAHPELGRTIIMEFLKGGGGPVVVAQNFE